MIANWLPEDLIKSTVLFQLKRGQNYNPIGTGLLVNYKKTFILVTCKHVVQDANGNEFQDLCFTVNRNNGTTATYNIAEVQEKFKIKWRYHKKKNVDLAVSPIAIDQGIDDIKLVPTSLFEDIAQMPVGDDIFFLGYPLKLGTQNVSKVTPLVRAGIISQKNEDSKVFLIDAGVYPGSSGSPVFYRPTIASSTNNGKKSRNGIKFLGIVSGHHSSSEVLISAKTGEQRMILQENAGLGVVYSADLVKEILDAPQFKAMLTRAENAQKESKGVEPTKEEVQE